jgi:hypothetical protein
MTALADAVELIKPSGSLPDTGVGPLAARVLRIADDFYQWLAGPVSLVIQPGIIVDQDTNTPTGDIYRGGTMQLHDDQKCTLDVEERDAKGVLLPDNVTWTTDPEAPEGTMVTWLVAGLPGSSVVTATDGTLTATLAVDVVPGDVALIQISAGEPVPQG